MFATMLKSFLPDDFDMEASIAQARQFFTDFHEMGQRLARIEARLDADSVAFRDSATVAVLEGEGNDRYRGATGAGDGATGSDISG